MSSTSREKCLAEECPARIMRCEEVLRSRTGRLLIVLDRVCDAHNIAAALRTSEALGVQHVWIVAPTMGIKSLGRPRRPRELQSIAKGSDVWLSVSEFETAEACAKALKDGGWRVWVTGDGDEALSLASPRRPEGIEEQDMKIAVVIGRETDGVCDEFATAADRQVFVEMTGFTASLNLSVATALIVQRIFDWFPEFKGDLTDEEKAEIRSAWRHNVAKNPAAREKLAHWFDHPDLIPIQKKRKATTAISNGSWAPKYIRDRDSAAAAKRARGADDKPLD